MTAQILQFPRQPKRKSAAPTQTRVCEVISLDDWRRQSHPRRSCNGVYFVNFGQTPQPELLGAS